MVRKDPKIYLEGAGSDSKVQKVLLQKALAALLKDAGFEGKMPRIVACGGRKSTFDKFLSGVLIHGEFSLLLVDSEDPVEDLSDDPATDFAWRHLEKRDGWQRPEGAHNRQALLMATCMESWIAADRETLRKYYGSELQESALPPLVELENRHRHEVQDALAHATRNCPSKQYEKGKPSFKIFGELNSNALIELSQFRRLVKTISTL